MLICRNSHETMKKTTSFAKLPTEAEFNQGIKRKTKEFNEENIYLKKQPQSDHFISKLSHIYHEEGIHGNN